MQSKGDLYCKVEDGDDVTDHQDQRDRQRSQGQWRSNMMVSMYQLISKVRTMWIKRLFIHEDGASYIARCDNPNYPRDGYLC